MEWAGQVAFRIQNEEITENRSAHRLGLAGCRPGAVGRAGLAEPEAVAIHPEMREKEMMYFIRVMFLSVSVSA